MLAFVSPCLLFNLVILLFIINNYESLWTRQFWASFSHTLSALTILYYQPLLSWLEEGPVRHLLKVTRAHMLILQLYCFSQTSITQISCLGKSVYWGYLSYFWISFSKKKKKTLKKRKKTPDIDNSYAQLVTLYYQDDEQSKGTGGSVLGTTDMWKADSRLYNLCWGHMLCDFSTAVLFSCKGLVPDGSGRLLVSICLPNITGFGGAKLEALLQSKHIWAPQYVASLPVPRQTSV